MYKRVYVKPKFEEVKMAVTQILCESNTGSIEQGAPELQLED